MQLLAAPLLAFGLLHAQVPEAADFTFVFLQSGPKEALLGADAIGSAMTGHRTNIRRLGDEGVMLLAGPFGEPRGNMRGIFVFDVASVDEAREHVASDPAVQAGALDALVLPFRCDPGMRRLPGLNRGARQARAARDPTKADSFEGRAYVLAMLPENSESATRLESWLQTPAVLFSGRLGAADHGTLLACLDATDLDDARRQLGLAGLDSLPWDLHILWATVMLEQLPQLRLRDDGPDFQIKPLPDAGPRSAFRPAFERVVDVFGIPIVATADTGAAQLLHAAHLMAQYLDNDEDGQVDDLQVLYELTRRGAFLAMAGSERAFERLEVDWMRLQDEGFHLGQDLYGDETHPGGAPHSQEPGAPFDAALEEVLHLVSQGWARAYPAAFSFERGSRLTDAMDLARGGRFSSVPDRYPEAAWYHYDDRTCHYECMAVEYFYWALTSLLDGQDSPGRAARIAHEWELPKPALLAEGDPAVHALLTDPSYALPRRLPDGSYAR
jgi:uncharacterized protein YciI